MQKTVKIVQKLQKKWKKTWKFSTGSGSAASTASTFFHHCPWQCRKTGTCLSEQIQQLYIKILCPTWKTGWLIDWYALTMYNHYVWVNIGLWKLKLTNLIKYYNIEVCYTISKEVENFKLKKDFVVRQNNAKRTHFKVMHGACNKKNLFSPILCLGL